MLPFFTLTHIEFIEAIQSISSKFQNLFETHNLNVLLQSHLPDIIHTNINCKYYIDSSLNQTLLKSTPALSIFHLNIRSFSKHRVELQAQLDALCKPFDVLCLTEIGQGNIDSIAALFEGYTIKYDPATTKCGGAALLFGPEIEIISVREDLHIKNKHDTDSNYLVENKWIEIKVKGLHSNVIIGCVYRHPNGRVEHFTEQFEKVMQSISKENKLCFVCGDFNINALNRSHSQTADFVNTILAQNFIPQITVPTRITENSATLIDNIFMKHGKKISNIDTLSGNLYCGITDHLPNFILYGEKKLYKSRPYVRIFSDKNITNFRHYLLSTDWTKVTKEQDCNKAYEHMLDIINVGYDKCFPWKQVSRARANDKKWITKGLIYSSNTKNRLYREYISRRTVYRKEKYKNYVKMFDKLCRKAEVKYFHELLDNTKASLKTLWDTFGPIINPSKKKTKRNIDKLVINNQAVVDKEEIANTLNNFFVNIGGELSKHMPTSNEYKKFLDHENHNSMFLQAVTETELTKEISKLNSKKSCGPDGITAKVVKACPELLSPLLHIINLSFKNGVFPDYMKIAKVIPIFKKNERYLPGNYRPISLLNIFSKVLEKLMSKRLMSFLKRNKILYDLQFGFRTGHSTSLALIDIHDRIQDALDSGKCVLGLYIDLKKAFDTVNHSILMTKLEHYGIRGHVHDWFKNYLAHRQQYVSVQGIDSSTKSIHTGVPQGSVLGPILFLLYVNDIANAIKTDGVKVMLFADDTNVFITASNLFLLKQKAQEVMKQLTQWFTCNKLTLNLDKTQYSIFRKGNMKIPLEYDSLTFNRHTIQRVDHALYLGAALDDKLNWNVHIKNLIGKLVKYASAFKIISRLVPVQCKKQLYYAYIYSHLQYGIEVYGHTTDQNLKSIQVMQNRILKNLYGKDWLTPTNILHKDLLLLKVQDIFKLKVNQFVFQHRKGLLPSVFDSYFTNNANVHNHKTRQSLLLHVPRTQSVSGQHTIKVLGVKLFNSLPNNITSITSVKSFKSKIRKHYIAMYV